MPTPNAVQKNITDLQKLIADLSKEITQLQTDNATLRAAYQEADALERAAAAPQSTMVGITAGITQAIQLANVSIGVPNRWWYDKVFGPAVNGKITANESTISAKNAQMTKAQADLATAILNADKVNDLSLTPDQKALLETTRAQNQSTLLKASSYAQNHKVIVVSVLLIVLILVAIIVIKKFIL